jgi:hypothetical protein
MSGSAAATTKAPLQRRRVRHGNPRKRGKRAKRKSSWLLGRMSTSAASTRPLSAKRSVED